MARDGFATGHGVARLVAMALPVVMFLVWWRMQGDHGEVVARSEASAVVEQVEGRTVMVRVATGERVRILHLFPMHNGMPLRMQRLQYEDGKVRFEPVAPAPAVRAE